MKPKIIFLDMDGVLITHHSVKAAHENRPHKDEVSRKIAQINMEAVEWLQEVIQETGALVVLSSAWRYDDWTTVRKVFKTIGIALHGETPRLGKERGAEIAKWLDENEHSSFVIVDDGEDMLHLKDKLVRTNMKYGLLPTHCRKMKEVLEDSEQC